MDDKFSLGSMCLDPPYSSLYFNTHWCFMKINRVIINWWMNNRWMPVWQALKQHIIKKYGINFSQYMAQCFSAINDMFYRIMMPNFLAFWWSLFLLISVWKFYSAHCLNTCIFCAKWVYTFTALKQPLRIENHTLHLVISIFHTKGAKYSKLTIYRGHSRQDIHSEAQLIFITRIMRQCQVNWSNGKFDAVYSISYIAFYLFIITVGKTLHISIQHLASNNCNLDEAFQ